jgi:hypothetical protein
MPRQAIDSRKTASTLARRAGTLQTMNQAAIRPRPTQQLPPPTRINAAFDDPGGVLDLIHRGAPYKSIAAVHKDPGRKTSSAWFRNFWALGGNVTFPGAEPYFHNPIFIAAAQSAFDARVIRPLAMMTNLNPPAPASDPHLDLPFFRGAHSREVPSWLLAPMGYSDLFHAWAIPVASAIAWFYEGAGGEFEYWPDGLDHPSVSTRAPYSNCAVLADNEYMYHRVGQIGRPEEFLSGNRIDYGAQLHDVDGCWRIVNGERLIAEYAYPQLRLSVLWKAFCFRDAAEAAAWSDHDDDLTPQRIVEIFSADLCKRGLSAKHPRDLTTDDAWRRLILETYRGATH